jgi:capsular exopolysaccharide synthesis family protein
VLLIDANFHRPGLQKVFSNIPAEGLSNILIGGAHLTDCVVKTGHGGLDVLGAGRIPPNPAELLVGGAWTKVLEQATSAYDQVIIDAAPLLLASDALVLASTVDGVILVVRARANSRGVARRAVTLLADVGARVFGSVLNAAQVTRGGYFREQFREYYEYQAPGDGR